MTVESTVELRRYADQVPQPWLGRPGVTRELARRDGADGGFVWRVSLADVGSDSDFSVLPGIDRVLMMCEGAGITLTGDGRHHELRLWDMLAFDGGIEVSCRLIDGPTRDLNVMTRRSECTVSVARYTVGSATLVCGAGQEQVIVLIDGQAAVEELGPLSTYDTVVLTGPAQVRIQGRAGILVATFHRR